MRYVHLALITLAACKTVYDGPDPAGTHLGSTPVSVHYEPRPPEVAFDTNMPLQVIVTKEKDDVYKVAFGACWARVRVPSSPPTWKVIDGSECKTNLGMVRISGGTMTVIENGRMRFSFEGQAPDGKTAVKFVFNGAIKS